MGRAGQNLELESWKALLGIENGDTEAATMTDICRRDKVHICKIFMHINDRVDTHNTPILSCEA